MEEMIDTEKAKIKLREISKKNESRKEYSLGDVLLLVKFEKVLKDAGFSKSEIEALSPSYYSV
jgi:hypothetical protein